MYTLVLDLDETLVHFEEMGEYGQFYVRPYATEFLIEMGNYYEIVIFTAAVQEVYSFNSKIISMQIGYRTKLTQTI